MGERGRGSIDGVGRIGDGDGGGGEEDQEEGEKGGSMDVWME